MDAGERERSLSTENVPSLTSSTQPLALSAGALPAVSRATSARGAAATCRAFGVTHDVGVGVLLWMFNLTKHMLPNYADNSWPPERSHASLLQSCRSHAAVCGSTPP